MFLYCIHMLTYWIKFDKFPVGFLLWLIFSAFNVIYEILVVRQHYMNYDIDLMKSKLVVDTGEILTQDLLPSQNPYVDHYKYDPANDVSYNNLSSH